MNLSYEMGMLVTLRLGGLSGLEFSLRVVGESIVPTCCF